jgi:orotate phosphoribosyltransferase
MKDKELAYKLLEINAVELRPQSPFTWASGIKSPIYCDNRQTLSFPDIRSYIKNKFATFIKNNYPQVEIIAGVATGAIAHGVLVAEALDLPFIYVRSKTKAHGKQNQIEGKFTSGQKVVVIEDLISTGGSSLSAVEALKNQNLDVLGLVAIFSYGFSKAVENFKQAKCRFDTLTDYDTLINIAVEKNFIKKEDLNILKNWRKNLE